MEAEVAKKEVLQLTNIDAAIFDLDGVITNTASVHAHAWKKMFDEYLQSKDGDFSLMEIEADYPKYIDGIPRYDGVRNFLKSREIVLDYGSPDDEPGKETVCGLGNRKNEIYLQLLSEMGFEVYDDAVKQIKKWKQKGIKTAIISSSKNCKRILDTAGLNELFDERIDGVTSEKLNLKGKPDPDIFTEAAKRLKTPPSRAVIFEDAISGVEAGKKGGFSAVVGVQRNGDQQTLKNHGADWVVQSLHDLELVNESQSGKHDISKLSSALEHHDEIKNQLGAKKLVLFLDYDGTLTPIVKKPSEATLSKPVKDIIEKLTAHCPIGVVSGRDLEDLRTKVEMHELYFAGCHGLDISGPGTSKCIGEEALPQLNDAEKELRKLIESNPGAQLERKKLIIAVHYRNASNEDAKQIKEATKDIGSRYNHLKILENKKVIELRPDVDWDKGKAIDFLIKEMDLDTAEVLPVFIGDDITDEDAFEYLKKGLGIVVGNHGQPSSAKYQLQDHEEVNKFLHQLADLLTEEMAYSWKVVYENYIPDEEPKREALCTLGNGYFATRGATEESRDDGIHYPGTYLAGGYNRLESEIFGKIIENEDLVNWPNWLPLTFRIDQGEWFHIDEVDVLDYQQVLDLKNGTLEKRILFRDKHQQETELVSSRLISQRNRHLAAIKWCLVPKNWSGKVEVRTALDGRVTNNGVKRYQDLNNRHLHPEGTGKEGETGMYLQARTNQSGILMVLAARTEVSSEAQLLSTERNTCEEEGYIEQVIIFNVEKLKPVVIEKIVAIYTSRDMAISDPGLEARKAISRASAFKDLLGQQQQVWEELWRRFDITIDESRKNQMILRLHIFHLLQTVSMNTMDLDSGVPARGWHGEAYRGHIFWDEIFIFPFINLRVSELSASLLMYRYRRLDEARAYACENGYKGAMFPWQSGSNGREESPKTHLNPQSGQWIPDNTYLQRHISADIVFNIIQYYEATEGEEFMNLYGAEVILEVANFFSSITTWSEEKQRYEILRVAGPDEYHTQYPGASEPGVNNNAYTNIMASWVLKTALELVDKLGINRHKELMRKLDLSEEDLMRWDNISRKMFVPFINEKIINQFEGYEKLKELDWSSYHKKYGTALRLDRILQAENDDVNNYKASKQADVLMLFYLFTAEELKDLFDHLDYSFDPAVIPGNISYYEKRTSHGSTLSQLVHSWVLARSERNRSWNSFQQALMSDFSDVQGGTTPEGIHLGAMAGTVDLIQRCYTGISISKNTLWINPQLPENLRQIKLRIRYQGDWIYFKVNHNAIEIQVEKGTDREISMGFNGNKFKMKAGDFKKIKFDRQ